MNKKQMKELQKLSGAEIHATISRAIKEHDYALALTAMRVFAERKEAEVIRMYVSPKKEVAVA